MHLLSGPEVAKRLNIAIVTLYKWISLGKIKAKRYSIGSRDYFGFQEDEVTRVSALLRRDRKPGKSIFKELIEKP